MTDKKVTACVATIQAAIEHVQDADLRAAARNALTELLRQLTSAAENAEREHFYRTRLPTF